MTSSAGRTTRADDCHVRSDCDCVGAQGSESNARGDCGLKLPPFNALSFSGVVACPAATSTCDFNGLLALSWNKQAACQGPSHFGIASRRCILLKIQQKIRMKEPA